MKNTLLKNKMPTLSEIVRATKAKNFIVIYDERLTQFDFFQKWLKHFVNTYAVRAGEDLKNLDHLPLHVRKLLPAFSGFAPRESVLISVGGGSVGDFSGFLASVIKRGVKYVHVPSTWLAAVDSAHGAKNGLNVDVYKNQVGTFYEAEKVYCVRELLMAQPQDNVRSAFGEVIKISLLNAKDLFKKLQKAKNLDANTLWQILPQAIQAKYKIVDRDPTEKNGIRHLLNLGHTLGHVLELDQLLPHGMAVQKGLEFSIDWSLKRKILSEADHKIIKSVLSKNNLPSTQPLCRMRMQRILQQDKKSVAGDRLRFVFIKKLGIAVIEERPILEVVNAACELGWAK